MNCYYCNSMMWVLSVDEKEDVYTCDCGAHCVDTLNAGVYFDLPSEGRQNWLCAEHFRYGRPINYQTITTEQVELDWFDNAD